MGLYKKGVFNGDVMSEYEKRLADVLTKLGLTRRESEVYIALLSMGKATVGELLETLDIHQPQLYNVLSSLYRKGFIQVISGRPKLYIANNPLSLIDSLQIELSGLKDEIRLFLEFIKKNKHDEVPPIAVTRGVTGLFSNLIELIDRSEIEVCAELPLQTLIRLKRHITRAMERGVNFYLLVFPRIETNLVDHFKPLKHRIILKSVRRGDFLLLAADTSLAIYSRRAFFTKKLRGSLEGEEMYGYVIREKDLIWRLLDIYGRSWKEGRTLLRWDVSPDSYPRIFLNFLQAFLEIHEIIKLNFKPRVIIEGKYTDTGEEVTIQGRALKATSSGKTSTIVVTTDEGQYTVGGFDAEEEDIEAVKIIIREITK